MKAISALYFRAITILATSALASLSGSAQIAMPQQSVTSGKATGYFAHNIPAESEILNGYSTAGQIEKMTCRPLSAIEGVWDFPDEAMKVTIERFSSPNFSPRLAFRVIMLEADDMFLLPGTVIGYIAESADNSIFDLWLYSEQQEQKLYSPVKCKATLSDNALLFERTLSLKMKVRVNFSRFLPKLFRGITISPEVKTEPLPVGFKRIFPKQNESDSKRIRFL